MFSCCGGCGSDGQRPVRVYGFASGLFMLTPRPRCDLLYVRDSLSRYLSMPVYSFKWPTLIITMFFHYYNKENHGLANYKGNIKIKNLPFVTLVLGEQRFAAENKNC